MKQLNVKKAGPFEPAIYPAGAVCHQPGGSLATCRRRGRFGQDAFVFLHATGGAGGAGGPACTRWIWPWDFAAARRCGWRCT